MKPRHLIPIGIELVLVILLATACASATPENITITFTADEKCTMEGPKTISAGKDTTIYIIGNNKEHGDAGVGIAKLDPDKTIEDLQDWQSDTQSPWTQPPWSLRVGMYAFPSDGSSYPLVLNQVDGPIYFLCMYDDMDRPIGALGPVEVK